MAQAQAQAGMEGCGFLDGEWPGGDERYEGEFSMRSAEGVENRIPGFFPKKAAGDVVYLVYILKENN